VELSGTEAARALAARRRQETRTCQYCGREFIGTVRAQYCSANCNQRAHYQRNAERKRAERRERYELARVAGADGDSPVTDDRLVLDTADSRSIRTVRLARGVAQRDLAARIGVPTLELRRWEHGVSEPTAEQWHLIRSLLS
jgi:ribosome-binding protein aMBF1 (putative translation factor)